MVLSVFISTKVRPTLQDVAKARWTDAEIESYVNDGLLRLAEDALFKRYRQTINVVEGTSDYTTTYTAFEIESIGTTQNYTLDDDNTIHFTDPTDEEVEIVYYGATATVSLSTDDEVPVPSDLIQALKYITLSFCYEKEDSTENFQKSMLFEGKYDQAWRRRSGRLQGSEPVELYKSDFLN